MKFPEILNPESTHTIDSGKLLSAAEQTDFGLMILMSESSVASRDISPEMAKEARDEWLRRHAGEDPGEMKDWAQVAHAIASGDDVPDHWSWWNPNLSPMPPVR